MEAGRKERILGGLREIIQFLKVFIQPLKPVIELYIKHFGLKSLLELIEAAYTHTNKYSQVYSQSFYWNIVKLQMR